MDNYKKLKVVGKGSFGCAILVQHIIDRKFYIMKVVLPLSSLISHQIIDVSKMDRKQREEALNEVTVLRALQHPYIISYRESFIDKK
jgi:NIMA (never in mitosis gene a)-related kinase